MKKIMYVCDRCGKEIKGQLFQITPQAVERDSEDILADQPDFVSGQENCHYCEDCTRRAISFLSEADHPCKCAEEQATEATPAEEQHDDGQEDDGSEDSEEAHIPEEEPRKNSMIKVKNLPPVKTYKGGGKGIDKNAVYGDFITMTGPKIYDRLAAKYGCSKARIGQIVKEMRAVDE